MTGSAYAIYAAMLLAGLFMIAMWLLRHRAQPGGLDRGKVSTRLIKLTLWICGLIILPVVAKPGSQPGWTALITLVTVVTVTTGLRDLRELNGH